MVDLSMFDDQYQAAKPPEGGGFENPPDGRYQAAIEKCELDTAGPEEKPVLRWSLRILAGPQAGKIIAKSTFITMATLPYVKKDLSLLGFAGGLSELNSPDVRMGFIGKSLEVQVQRKGEYKGEPNVNVWFNKVIEVGAATQAARAASGPDDRPLF